ncbi:MAG: type II toxin-antitoxin system RatA family toxin [Hyphomicrobiales bacterium]|nr:type II toxin-antitoxin system RatA family toxin [Hyphomicrobiales bacterium]
MPRYQTSRRAAHSAEDMFALVAGVEHYPEFLPLCEATHVSGREFRDGREIIVADMTVAYKIIRETFTSRAVFDRDNLKIDVDYLDGPFRHLENRWTFAPDGERACTVHFAIDYEFKTRALGLVMGAMFDKAFRKFAEAFEARADAVYGR